MKPAAAAPPERPAAAQALRESEPVQPAAAPPRQAPAQEIAVRIGRPDAPPVDVQMAERGGQVRVDVRTQDPALQSSLRQELGTLVNSLERSGFRTEAFVPAEISRPAASLQPAASFQAHTGTASSGERENRREGRYPRQQRTRRTPKAGPVEVAA